MLLLGIKVFQLRGDSLLGPLLDLTDLDAFLGDPAEAGDVLPYVSLILESDSPAIEHALLAQAILTSRLIAYITATCILGRIILEISSQGLDLGCPYRADGNFLNSMPKEGQ
jgi:hypothetical protein